MVRMNRPVVAATGLGKVYGSGAAAVTALDDVSVEFRAGRFVSIMGPSGSGKSTLLHCLAGLDRPTSGTVRIADTDLAALSDRRLTDWRRDRLGFVFQAFNLVPTLSARENITLGSRIGGAAVDQCWLGELVDILGLRDRLEHRPAELSGGQQQRVALARALVHRPQVVFADEPTGNLDSRTGAEVLGFLAHAAGTLGHTVVMVTHDPIAAGHTERALFLHDGHVRDELHAPTANAVLHRLGAWEGRA